MVGGARPKTEPAAEPIRSGESPEAANWRKMCSDKARHCASQLTEKLRVGIAAALSFRSRQSGAQELSLSREARENSVGSRSVNLPCPSFNNTATGRCCHAVVTTRSRDS